MNVLTKLVQKAAKQAVLDKAGDRLAMLVDGALAKAPDRQAIEDALHGTWLGHPIHPMLTSLPIGAWSFAAVLDVLAMISGRRSSAATAAIQFGVLTTLPTAAAGAVDWRQTDGEARRVGTAHSMMNSGALMLYIASLGLRGHNLGLARLLSFSGLAVLGVSGYFGGHLVVHYRVGVRHEAEPARTPVFSEATLGEDLAEDTPKRIEVDGMPLMAVRHAGRVYALSDVCPHLGCSLSEGALDGDSIVCPCHGSTFALEDGRVIRGPSPFPVEAYHAWSVDDDATPGLILDPGTE